MEKPRTPGALFTELGQAFFQVGRYDEAVNAYGRALKEGVPDTGRVQLALGRTYLAMNKKDEAFKAFQEAERQDPSVLEEAKEEILQVTMEAADSEKKGFGKKVISHLLTGSSVLLGLGIILPVAKNLISSLIKSEQYSEAERIARSIVAGRPRDAEAQEILGITLMKQGKLTESAEAMKAAIEHEPNRVTSLNLIGEVYSKMGKYLDALDMFKRSIEVRAGQPDALLLRGLVFRKLGEFADCEQDLLRVVELEPDNHRPYLELAEIYQLEGRPREASSALYRAAQKLTVQLNHQDALRFCEQAARLDSTNSGALLLQGKIMAELGRHDGALGVLEKAARIEPTTEAFLGMATILCSRRNYDDALEKVENAISLSGEAAEPLSLKGAILHELGKDLEALEVLDQALQLDPERAETHATRGVVLEAAGKRSDAIASLKKAVSLLPNLGWVYESLGRIHLLENQNEEALQALAKALELIPTPGGELHRAMGQALLNLGRCEEALPNLEKALQTTPNDVRASHLLSLAMLRLNRYEEAISSAQLTIDLHAASGEEGQSPAYAVLGEAYRLSNRLREAQSAFERIITSAQKEENEWVLSRYGETLRVLGQYDQAIEYLKKAIDIDPEYGWAWSSLGTVYADRGWHRSALDSLSRAIEIDPEDSWSLATKGRVHRNIGDHPEAFKAFDRALSNTPDLVWVYGEKALALLEQGPEQCEEAIKVLEKSLELDPNFSWGMAQLARCLYLVGRYEEAIRAADKAYRLDPSTGLLAKCLSLDKLGRKEEARRVREQFLEEPTTPEGYAARAGECIQLKEFELAEQDLKEGCERFEESDQPFNELAWLYAQYMGKDLENAQSLALKAVELAEKTSNKKQIAFCLDTLGWIYYKRGLRKEALRTLEEAARVHPEDLVIAGHLEACRKAPGTD